MKTALSVSSVLAVMMVAPRVGDMRRIESSQPALECSCRVVPWQDGYYSNGIWITLTQAAIDAEVLIDGNVYEEPAHGTRCDGSCNTTGYGCTAEIGFAICGAWGLPGHKICIPLTLPPGSGCTNSESCAGNYQCCYTAGSASDCWEYSQTQEIGCDGHSQAVTFQLGEQFTENCSSLALATCRGAFDCSHCAPPPGD